MIPFLIGQAIAVAIALYWAWRIPRKFDPGYLAMGTMLFFLAGMAFALGWVTYWGAR